MSAVVHHDYASSADADLLSSQPWPVKRLLIAAAGCAVMAFSGSGLANYLGTSTVTGPDAPAASPTEAATLN